MRSATPLFAGPRTMLKFAALTAALAFIAVFASPVQAEPGDNSLVSVNPTTQRAAGRSYGSAAISDSGRYLAFASEATTLVAGDTNGWSDVFVRDRTTGITQRVSVGIGGVEPNGGAYSPAISGDGRYVAYQSWASNLVANDTNGKSDVFVYDRSIGTTRRASVAPGGGSLVSWAYVGVGGISDDGRFVTFECAGGIYVRDMVAGVTSLVVNLGYPTTAPVISGNGRYVLYTHPLGPQLYVYDRQEATRQLLSAGNFNEERYFRPYVSRDGRWVAYSSIVSEVAADTNGNVDAYLLDRATGVKRVASVSANGQQTAGYSFAAAVSDSGRYVAIQSYGAGLLGLAPADQSNLLIKDMQTGVVEFVAASDHEGTSLSADGGLVAFGTEDALVVQDLNASLDTYVHETGQSSTLPLVYNYYLRPLRIDFGAVRVSSSLTKGFQLVNAGTTPLPVTLVELTGPNRPQFELMSYCKSPLPAGGRCWISVTFRPTTVGIKEVRLHVIAGGIERYRAVTGTGVP